MSLFWESQGEAGEVKVKIENVKKILDLGEVMEIFPANSLQVSLYNKIKNSKNSTY